MNLSKNFNQIYAALTACCGGFIIGSILGLFFPIFVQQMQYSSTGIKTHDRNIIIICGAALSTIPIALFPGRIGRKSAMQLASIILSLLWFTIAICERFNMIKIAFWIYFICGFFTGVFCVFSPIYIAEIADRHLRSRLISCYQLFIHFGIFYTIILAKVIHPKNNTDRFFTILMNFVIMPAIMSILLFFIPESPFYLISEKKSLTKIFNAYNYLHGNDYDPTSVIREIEGYFNETNTIANSNKKVVIHRIKLTPTIRAFYICLYLISTHDIFGLYMVWHLISYIGTKLSFSDQRIILLIFGPLIFGSITAIFLVTCLSQRRLLMISYGMMTILSMMIVACSFLPRSSTVMYTFPIYFAFAMIIAYTLGAAPLTWLLICEILPPDIRGFGSSICAFFMWFMDFLFIRLYHYLYTYFGELSVFWICACFNLISFVIVILFLTSKRN